MPLKQDIQRVFEGTIDNEYTQEDIAKEIASAYKKSVSNALDQYGNKWSVKDFSLLENAIVSQFELSFAPARVEGGESNYLRFNLIESSLVSLWATATLKIPAPPNVGIPAPGMSIVNSGVIVASTPPGIRALSEITDSYDNIVNAFNSMFVNHAKSISYNYIGISSTTPPVPITVPGSRITLI